MPQRSNPTAGVTFVALETGGKWRIAFVDGRFSTVSHSHPCSPRVCSGMVREVGQDVGALARGRSLLRSAALKKNDTETF